MLSTVNPELKKSDDDNPFQASYFENRRNQLLKKIEKDSIVILFTADVKHRNDDVDFPFRQESNFYYLTGWNEENAIAVLIPGENNTHQFILFCQKKDPKQEVWTGRIIGQEKAKEIYRADEAYVIDEFKAKLPELLKDRKKIYYSELDARKHEINPEYKKILLDSIGDIATTNIMPMIHEMRLVKDKYEMECINKAIEITAKGHFRTMLLTNESMKREYEIEAEFVYPITKQGARTVGYPNIVATGENACILHYPHNNAKLKKGALTLMDAGAEFENYTADITRTFPINGKFSKEQRDIYELVLKAQEEGIKHVIPGTTWKAIENVVARVLTEGLMKLGILEGKDLEGEAFDEKLDELLEKGAYEPFYMHNPGHWMGLDVHDPTPNSIPTHKSSKDKYFRVFEKGMVITMEPGIYIAPGTPNVDPKWYDIGVRIEDDLLVTSHGCKVLSDYLPRQVSDIEAIMAGQYKLTDSRLMDLQEYEKLVAEKRFQKSKETAVNSGQVQTLFPNSGTRSDCKAADSVENPGKTEIPVLQRL